jgi:predicted patatin/cPLA2 family phospholipase
MRTRHERYNRTIELIEKLEKEGKIFVIRPKTPIKIGRLEKDKGKLTELYKVGYDDAKEYYESLEKYLGI